MSSTTSRGPDSQRAVAAPTVSASGATSRGAAAAAATATTLMQRTGAAPLPAQQQQQPLSPSVIHLTVASGAVVAPELDYTVGVVLGLWAQQWSQAFN